MNARWSVLALYENEAARKVAMKFCDGLVQRFWAQCGFDLNWASWRELEELKASRHTERWAAQADLIIVATDATGPLPNRVSWWLVTALRKRGDREGVLVGLPLPEAGLGAEAAAAQVHLRRLAHENGMDYLTALPENLPRPEPETVESYSQRATQVTSVLDRILRQAPLPDRTLKL